MKWHSLIPIAQSLDDMDSEFRRGTLHRQEVDDAMSLGESQGASAGSNCKRSNDCPRTKRTLLDYNPGRLAPGGESVAVAMANGG